MRQILKLRGVNSPTTHLTGEGFEGSYDTVLDMVDDWQPFVANHNMKVRHYRLYRNRADRCREVILIYHPVYAGYGGEDYDNPKCFAYIIVCETGDMTLAGGDLPLVLYREFKIDIRRFVADDFTLGVVNGEIRLARVLSEVPYILDVPCLGDSLGDTAHYTPAFLHEGRGGLSHRWFVY